MTSYVPARASAWFEIPVRDLDRARAFYGAVLQTEIPVIEGDPNPIAIFPSEDEKLAGHLYPGKPAGDGTGPTVHLFVAAPLESAMERVKENGGQVVSPILAVPSGSFVYCIDPDGNSFGLFV
ncbi:hypothetical protein MesoLjLc_13550 [Mesorhizobium sp. L-8-10]|uniref:VOC family protein n=1 Tax=unclassified Mesorhizobium TaxID=325217 RepID=UPI0019286A79|nr:MULTISPECIES: VOC family protein [unclassified Mesorhizobium]BCH21738.1 hypothetical protein MesoLjLb_15230 [Mesorhizobium sp. L-8-3]BCH29425.1 hypothetical protein MesoLjLc_13550 [Mesorhizobium sp. L-8-10]